MTLEQPDELMERFHRVLVEEIRRTRPEYLEQPFTVAEVYQQLVPYGSHREKLQLEMNGDYEDVLLRLLAGEGGYLVLESEAARTRLRDEVGASNPDTGLYREYAAVDVRLNPEMLNGFSEDPDTIAVEDLAPDDLDEADDPEEKGTETSDQEVGIENEGHDVHEEFDAEMDETTDETAETVEPAAITADGGGRSRGDGDDSDEERPCAWCREVLPNRDNLNFCPFCGISVTLKPCSSCGEAVEPGWLFCGSCGIEL